MIIRFSNKIHESSFYFKFTHLERFRSGFKACHSALPVFVILFLLLVTCTSDKDDDSKPADNNSVLL